LKLRKCGPIGVMESRWRIASGSWEGKWVDRWVYSFMKLEVMVWNFWGKEVRWKSGEGNIEGSWVEKWERKEVIAGMESKDSRENCLRFIMVRGYKI